MTILVAMDSLKGSLSSSLANQAIRGIHPSEYVRTVVVAECDDGLRFRHATGARDPIL